MSVVYLIHLDRPLSDKSPSRHYLGWCRSIQSRALAHLKGRGARFTAVACERNIAFSIVRTWPGGTRALERKLKNRHNAPQLCPVCRAARTSKPVEEDLL